MAKQHVVKSPMAVGGKVKVACVAMASIACLLGASLAHAEEDVVPLYLTMSQVMEHDNNLLRDNENRVAAVVASTKARVGLDKTYGRQHYQADVELAKNRYMRNDSYNVGKFDNDSHTATASFMTDIASDFRWNVNGKSTRSLPAFENSSLNRSQRNIMTTKYLTTDLRYGLHGRMSVNAGISANDMKFDVTDDENRKSRSAYVGLRYLPNELMYFGLTYTRTNTDYPRRDVDYETGGGISSRTGEEVRSDNLGFNAAWQVTGFSRFAGTIGYSSEKYVYDRRRNFDGLTGSAAWKFTPAGKVSYDLKWSRDTNNSGSGTYSDTYIDLTQQKLIIEEGYIATNRVTNTYSAAANYEFTSKISFSLSYSYITYNEESSLASASRSTKGRYTGYSLGADYAPLDSLAFGCSASFYDRTRSVFQVDFDGRSLSCYAAFTLQ